jgi:segregation and condensation protein A
MEPSPDFESSLEAYPIKLSNFEGPLDLLIHLIRKNQVNVYDIPVALITEQYLAYIEVMQELNLDVASEFLVMAATLIHIKSRLLLPRPPAEDNAAEQEEDPREALVRRLLEHERFKAAAELLHERETVRAAQWTRSDSAVAELAGEDGVLERAKRRPKVYLPPEQVSIESRIEILLTRLSETEACGFEDLFGDVSTRPDMIVTFLALLEMIRLKLVRIFQSGPFGAIRVYKRPRPSDAPHPIKDPQDVHDALARRKAETEGPQEPSS